MEIMQTAEEKAWGEMAEISQIKNLAGIYMGNGRGGGELEEAKKKLCLHSEKCFQS